MTTRRSIVWISLGLVLLAAIVWSLRPRPVPVEVASVRRGLFVATLEDDGVIRVRDRYLVTAPVAGVLARLPLRVGDRVEKGQVIGHLLPNPAQFLDARTRAELAARIEAAADRSARAATAARQAQAAQQQAELELRRIKDLRQQGFVAQSELDRLQLDVDLKTRNREASEFERDAARHDLEQARAALRPEGNFAIASRAGRWLLTSPIAGQVLRVHQDSEGPVAIASPIVEVGDVSRLEGRIDVLTSEATQVNRDAIAELDAGSGLRLSGRVRLVEPTAITKVSALGVEEQRVNVIVDLLPNPATLSRVGDGYHVDARIEIAHEPDVIMAPVAALFRDGDQWAVFRIRRDRAELTPVTAGPRNREQAVIRRGLEPGDQVVLYPSDALHHGARVTRLSQSARS